MLDARISSLLSSPRTRLPGSSRQVVPKAACVDQHSSLQSRNHSSDAHAMQVLEEASDEGVPVYESSASASGNAFDGPNERVAGVKATDTTALEADVDKTAGAEKARQWLQQAGGAGDKGFSALPTIGEVDLTRMSDAEIGKPFGPHPRLAHAVEVD